MATTQTFNVSRSPCGAKTNSGRSTPPIGWHSYDIGASEVSVSASDVIHHGHGICFAKAHLLAALLRSNAIPAGLCYRNLLVAIRVQEQPAYMA
jgi:Transglutaminase-like superfamily